MNTAEYVSKLISDQKAAGTDPQAIAWNAALACVGWAYVFGARGQYCDPVNRRNAYASHGTEHPTIKSACRNFNGSDKTVGACASCKWYPGGRTRYYDCRGFTFWILKQVYGWELNGAGATSQWNNSANWTDKGPISTMPANMLVCLFVKKGSKMEHTGFGLNNETIECSSGVQHFTTRNKKWTHWAVPKCVSGSVTPTPAPDPEPSGKPTLKKGSSGEYVTLLQTMLINKGYSCGSCGADGKFGNDTQYAVKKFQMDNGLQVDGVVGKSTWDALESTGTAVQTYTVHIPFLPKYKAEALVAQYSGASMTAEGSGAE